MLKLVSVGLQIRPNRKSDRTENILCFDNILFVENYGCLSIITERRWFAFADERNPMSSITILIKYFVFLLRSVHLQKHKHIKVWQYQ